MRVRRAASYAGLMRGILCVDTGSYATSYAACLFGSYAYILCGSPVWGLVSRAAFTEMSYAWSYASYARVLCNLLDPWLLHARVLCEGLIREGFWVF